MLVRILYQRCSRWLHCPPWYQDTEAWCVEFCSKPKVYEREGYCQPEQSEKEQTWFHHRDQMRLFRGEGCQTHHHLVLCFFQGTQKICLPYSPTKTLSVKSILRWVLRMGPHYSEGGPVCIACSWDPIRFPWLALCLARHHFLESPRQPRGQDCCCLHFTNDGMEAQSRKTRVSQPTSPTIQSQLLSTPPSLLQSLPDAFFFFPCVHLGTLDLERKSRNLFHFILILWNRNPDVSKGSLGDVLYSSLNKEWEDWNIWLLPLVPASLSSPSQAWRKLPLRWSLSFCPQLRHYILMTVTSLSNTVLNAFPAFSQWL